MSKTSLLETARNAVSVIKNGGLALTPADIGYGLLGNSEYSIRKMYSLKGRSFTNPCIVAGNIDVLAEVAVVPDDGTLDWLRKISQESTLAVVFPLNKESQLARSLSPWVIEHSTENESIAVFLNCGPIVDQMVRLATAEGMLLVGSSGNFSKSGNNFRLQDVPLEIREGVDFSCDMGVSKYENPERMATTILNFRNYSVRRMGVNGTEILNSYRRFATRHNLPLFQGEAAQINGKHEETEAQA
ncbi:Sua5/YciO/YrdC/YwlC family protein [uncultured Marinobacter sp.]|uniref:Sua5/YciO/YrdC/YwlC family protein n=1 Tax=uncultured Marinobacter sp. TaxID=187379 RepID=UPI0030DB40D2